VSYIVTVEEPGELRQYSDYASGWTTVVLLPTGAMRYSSLRHRFQTGSETHPASYSMGTADFFDWGQNGRGVNLNTHLSLVQKLRIRGAISPLLARMGEWRGAYRVLVWRPEGKRPLGRPRRRGRIILN
jgi:hypothetical protein